MKDETKCPGFKEFLFWFFPVSLLFSFRFFWLGLGFIFITFLKEGVAI